MTSFLNYLVAGLTRGSMYALIALGYTLVYGVLQLINFAHSEVFMSGAFGSYLVVHELVGTGKSTPGWALPFVIVIGMAVGAVTAGIIAWILERVAYRPLRRRGAPKLAFLISAIGASFSCPRWPASSSTVRRRTSSRRLSPTGSTGRFHHRRGARPGLADCDLRERHRDHDLPRPARHRDKTRPQHPGGVRGRATAALMGIDIDKTISRTFVIGGLLGGVAGFLFGLTSPSASTWASRRASRRSRPRSSAVSATSAGPCSADCCWVSLKVLLC